MSKFAIVGIIVATLAIVAGLAWLAQPKTQAGNQNHNQVGNVTTASALKSDMTLFDFGTISMAKGNVAHQFKIANNSDKPVTLNKIFTSCMCTVARFELNGKTYGPFGMEGMGGDTSVNVTMNPGDIAIAKAVYDPKAHGPAGVGAIDRFVSLQDESGEILELEIKALVTP